MRLDERRRGLMLVLLGRGRSCHSIARELGGSPSTVRKVWSATRFVDSDEKQV